MEKQRDTKSHPESNMTGSKPKSANMELNQAFFDLKGIDCIHFNGYKPCFPGVSCAESCDRQEPIGMNILIVNLDAMGDVLMTTAQLPAIRETWPVAKITWLTLANASSLLAHNPLIDEVMEWNDVNRLIIQTQYWDVVLNADKSREACAFVASLKVTDPRGFTLSDFGQIMPANPEAAYNFRMGIDDELKFRLNKRTGQSILAETWDLPYDGAEYILELTDEEKEFCGHMRTEWALNGRTVVGINTGCSELFPNKKMTVDQHVKLIEMLVQDKDTVVLLLGGGDTDRKRNAAIMEKVHAADRQVISTPTDEGLRRGICYENLADVIITGDTFGMHLGIALRKHVLVWFGLSCWEEIELYGRGTKYHPNGLACAPCWKRTCPNNLECLDLIPVEAIAAAVRDYSEKNLRQRTGDIA